MGDKVPFRLSHSVSASKCPEMVHMSVSWLLAKAVLLGGGIFSPAGYLEKLGREERVPRRASRVERSKICPLMWL